MKITLYRIQRMTFHISKKQKINERINIFRDLFIGRTDVYAVRWESKSGKSGYSPACKYEWQPPHMSKTNHKMF